MAMKKMIYFPRQTPSFNTAYKKKSKQNGICTKMPANTQKNADSLYSLPPSLDILWEGVGIFCTNTPTEDIHVS